MYGKVSVEFFVSSFQRPTKLRTFCKLADKRKLSMLAKFIMTKCWLGFASLRIEGWGGRYGKGERRYLSSCGPKVKVVKNLSCCFRFVEAWRRKLLLHLLYVRLHTYILSTYCFH